MTRSGGTFRQILLHVNDVVAGGIERRYEASAEECTIIATELGIEAVSDLRADVVFRPWRPGGRGGVAAKGTLTAKVRQLCVVTLEPVETAIETELEEQFLPREAMADQSEIDIDDPSDAEPFDDGAVDVGRFLIDSLETALDPYPRAPDARIELSENAEPAQDDAGGGGTQSPFAALAVLKSQDDG